MIVASIATSTVPGDTRPPTFIDPVHQDELEVLGYTTIPLLSADQIDTIRSFHRDVCPSDGSGLVIDFLRTDRELVRRIHEFLQPLLSPVLDQHLVDHEPCLISMVNKYPGEDTSMILHDDWSFVDEERARSVTLWLPLTDVGPDVPNGGLVVVPGSHRIHSSPNGSLTPDPYRPYQHTLLQALVQPTVPAGHGLFYDSRLLHASDANRTTTVREVLGTSIAPRSEQLLHVVATGRRRRRLFAVDRDFFIEQHPRALEEQVPPTVRMVDEWEEEPHDPSGDIAAALGLSERPRPDVVLGSTSIGVPSGVDRIGHLSGAVPHSDLGLRAGDLYEPSLLPSRQSYAVHHGVVGVAALSPSSVIPVVDHVVEADVVALDPGTHLDMTTSSTRSLQTVAVVVDAPYNGAYLRHGKVLAQCSPGMAVRLDPTVPLELHTEGPGATVVVLITRPVQPNRVGSAAARFVRSLGPYRDYHTDRSAMMIDMPVTGPAV